MGVPPTPYINLQTCSIVPSGSSVAPNQTFYWYNPTAGECRVTINGIWCTQPSTNPVPSNGSASSTVAGNIGGGTYTFTASPCCPSNMPVHVSPGHPRPPKEEK
jgi:hypothetical protein